MPGATARGMHVDQLLTQMAMGYRPDGMIADMIMPIVTVQKQSDHYLIHSRADKLRIENDKRSPGTRANVITQNVSSDTFFCENYAFRYPVTIEDKANADPVFVQTIINGRATFILDKLALNWEGRVADLVNNTSNVGSSAAVSSGWTDYTNSDVQGDIDTALNNVQDATGKKPNVITLGLAAWRNARRNVPLRNIVNGTDNGGGYLTVQQFAAIFEVDKVLIGGAYKNTGNEAQSEALESIWGDNVLVSHTAPVATQENPSFAYAFRWQGNGLPAPLVVERHPYDPREKAEDVEAGFYQAEKITGKEYGFLLTAVNSST